MSVLRTLVCAALLSLAASPALAEQPSDRGPTPGLGWGPGGSTGFGAPGPVAGVGLPALVVAGGYVWFVWRKRRGKAKKRTE